MGNTCWFQSTGGNCSYHLWNTHFWQVGVHAFAIPTSQDQVLEPWTPLGVTRNSVSFLHPGKDLVRRRLCCLL